ncbi:MAG: XrtA system polysaccharide deacetylase [Pseudomonadota bacterium]
MKNTAAEKSILLTFDVEDWFQVENFKGCIPFASWPLKELRVEANIHKILDLLDSLALNPKATFFILGWIAQKVPWLVREIKDRGHEIASHGNHHHLCTSQNRNNLLQDLQTSRMLLEDLSGSQVFGYRAPSFAVNDAILTDIKAAGYRYDSSYNSFSMHGRYGKLDLGKSVRTGVAYCFGGSFFELPVSNLTLGGRVLPLGGGGYFRLIPFPFFKQGVKCVLARDNAFVFYSHPWEFDPEQPRVNQAPPGFRFRHYVNVKHTENKLLRLIKSFKDQNFQTCSAYLLSGRKLLCPDRQTIDSRK